MSTSPIVSEADLVLVMDCDVPWVPTQGKPSDSEFAHTSRLVVRANLSLQ